MGTHFFNGGFVVLYANGIQLFIFFERAGEITTLTGQQLSQIARPAAFIVVALIGRILCLRQFPDCPPPPEFCRAVRAATQNLCVHNLSLGLMRTTVLNTILVSSMLVRSVLVCSIAVDCL